MNHKQFPELDALRAFAVTVVVWSHTVEGDLGIGTYRIGGYHGVHLFFVISGFLITGILLDARAGVAERPASVSYALRAFYVRRFLRIFPIYYAVLFVTFVAGIGSVRDELGWHLAYLSNWYFAARGAFGDSTAHLWSLAVEEQFYLVWPWFALLLPNAALPWAIATMILAGPVSRLMLVTAGANELAVWITTPTVLDSLGLGCLLALSWRRAKLADRLARGALLSAALLFGVQKIAAHALPESLHAALGLAPWALVCLWLVHRGAKGVPGVIGQVLRAPPLLHVGKVSYAIYLFHPFVAEGFAHPGKRQFLAVMAISVAAATLSWRFFEQPINSRKEQFPYVSGRASP